MSKRLLGLILGVALVLGIATSLGVRVALADVVAVDKITLDKPSLTLTVGVPEKLTATVKPDNATNKQVQWKPDASCMTFYADPKMILWIT